MIALADTLIVGVVVAVASLVGTVIVNRLQRSGKISTSEAARLWDKTDKIEKDLHAIIAIRDARIAILEARIETEVNERLKLYDQNVVLRIENAQGIARLVNLEQRLAALQQ